MHLIGTGKDLKLKIIWDDCGSDLVRMNDGTDKGKNRGKIYKKAVGS